MKWVAAPGNPGRGARKWWVLTSILLLLAAGSLTYGGYGHHGRPLASAGSPFGAGSPFADQGTTTWHPAPSQEPPRSEPVALRIPAIDLSASVSPLGLNADRTIEVPTDFQRAGWYRLGPTPGQIGSAVILGHVDSYQGPAVFFRLSSLVAGDQVEVTLADGRTLHFVVQDVEMYLKQQFPTRQVYGSHGISALQLITCGGEFDDDTRSYLSNVVVYTSLATATPPPG